MLNKYNISPLEDCQNTPAMCFRQACVFMRGDLSPCGRHTCTEVILTFLCKQRESNGGRAAKVSECSSGKEGDGVVWEERSFY